MSKNIGIIDCTVRDGQQSLWATRMTTAMMLPILPVMDRVGYYHIECIGTAVMDACVRWLKENPWDRLRMIRERVQKTPLSMITVSTGFSVTKPAMPDDIMDLYFERCAANGIKRLFYIDGLNDTRNCVVPIRACKKYGMLGFGAITYSHSPVHTDEHFVQRVRELVELGTDYIILKDPNGLMTAERVRTLVPAMTAAAKGVPIVCHAHCVIGLGPATNLEAVKQGVEAIWTAAEPLANGASLPSTTSMVRHLERMGYETGIDKAAMAEVSQYFYQLAKKHNKPVGKPAEYDPSVFGHQLPGGMISNFRSQLAQLGIENRLEEVLEAIPRVREELGWSLMVTPFSQIIGTQAALNVLYGPYEVVLDETERLVLGHYGRTPAPIDPKVLDKASKGRQPITERPGYYLEPAVERFRKDRGPFPSDEDMLLNYFFMPDTIRQLYEAGPIKTEDTVSVANPLVNLVREVAKRKDVTEFHLVKY